MATIPVFSSELVFSKMIFYVVYMFFKLRIKHVKTYILQYIHIFTDTLHQHKLIHQEIKFI